MWWSCLRGLYPFRVTCPEVAIRSQTVSCQHRRSGADSYSHCVRYRQMMSWCEIRCCAWPQLEIIAPRTPWTARATTPASATGTRPLIFCLRPSLAPLTVTTATSTVERWLCSAKGHGRLRAQHRPSVVRKIKNGSEGSVRIMVERIPDG